MTDHLSKYTIIEPTKRGNAVAVGFLLGGLMVVAALMLAFAPLDSRGNASTLKPTTQFIAPR